MTQNNISMIILGIDPGLATTGFGVIKKQGNCLTMVDYGVITTKARRPFVERLEEIYRELNKIIAHYKPDLIGVEELFFCKNVKTALLVGQARGVVLLTAIQNKLSLREFTPLEVKQAVTGYGRADKKQIQQMVKIILNLKKIPQPDDAADALAIAITAANTKNFK